MKLDDTILLFVKCRSQAAFVMYLATTYLWPFIAAALAGPPGTLQVADDFTGICLLVSWLSRDLCRFI